MLFIVKYTRFIWLFRYKQQLVNQRNPLKGLDTQSLRHFSQVYLPFTCPGTKVTCLDQNVHDEYGNSSCLHMQNSDKLSKASKRCQHINHSIYELF